MQRPIPRKSGRWSRGLKDADEDEEKEVSAETIDRIKALWEWRVQEAGGILSKEFEGFGWWFASGKFDDAWAMEQLAVALKLAGKVEPDDMVVERLETLVTDMPKRAVECLRMIVDGDIERWAIHGWMDRARTILEKAIQGQTPEAREAAVDLVHRLGARGYLEFRDLLPKT